MEIREEEDYVEEDSIEQESISGMCMLSVSFQCLRLYKMIVRAYCKCKLVDRELESLNKVQELYLYTKNLFKMSQISL